MVYLTNPSLPYPRAASDPLKAVHSDAFGHVLALLGSYRAFDAPGLAMRICRLDTAACRWAIGADTQELRSVFRPRPLGEPVYWTDVTSPCYGDE